MGEVTARKNVSRSVLALPGWAALPAVLALVVLTSLPACKRSASGGGGGSAEPVSITLDVQGMTCGSCEQAIQKEVSRLPGVLSVKASVARNMAWVTYQRERVTREAIINTINALGYRASLAP